MNRVYLGDQKDAVKLTVLCVLSEPRSSRAQRLPTWSPGTRPVANTGCHVMRRLKPECSEEAHVEKGPLANSHTLVENHV